MAKVNKTVKKASTKVAKKAIKKPVKKPVKKQVSRKAHQNAVSSSIAEEKAVVKKSKKSIPFIVAIVAVVVIAIVIAFMSTREKKIVIVPVNSIEELNNKLKVTVKTPENTKKVTYGIENNNIARIEYSKDVSDGYTMDFVLKSSSATEDLVEYTNNFGSIAILMTVICNDGSDIEVTSYVAADDPLIMKSEWYDNDLYYAMTTENLVTREDFLQEVNRVIIDNHINF